MICNVQRTKCLHVCLHIDWNPYGTFNVTMIRTSDNMTMPRITQKSNNLSTAKAGYMAWGVSYSGLGLDRERGKYMVNVLLLL